MKKRWVVLMLVPAVLLGGMRLFAGERGAQRWTTLLFTCREGALVRAAEAALAGEPVKTSDLWGTRLVKVWSGERDSSIQIVEFLVGGWGIGSQAGYWGLYTTTNGEPAGFQGAAMNLTPSGAGYVWEEANGDNTYYTEKLAEGWYYYRAGF